MQYFVSYYDSDGYFEPVQLRFRCSVGELSEEQYENYFVNTVRDFVSYHFKCHSVERIQDQFREESQVEHVKALKAFDEQKQSGDGISGRGFYCDIIREMIECQNIAETIRTLCPNVNPIELAPVTSKTVVADCPRHEQALTGVGVPDTVEALYNQSIEDSDGSLVNVNIADVAKPIPVFLVAPPKDATLAPHDCPIEGKGGFWLSQKDYAKRVNLQSSTLTAYRKSSAGARWSSDGTWGETAKGEHVFKQAEPSKTNSEFLWFFRNK